MTELVSAWVQRLKMVQFIVRSRGIHVRLQSQDDHGAEDQHQPPPPRADLHVGFPREPKDPAEHQRQEQQPDGMGELEFQSVARDELIECGDGDDETGLHEGDCALKPAPAAKFFPQPPLFL